MPLFFAARGFFYDFTRIFVPRNDVFTTYIISATCKNYLRMDAQTALLSVETRRAASLPSHVPARWALQTLQGCGYGIENNQ
jgi:hypothetical protein